MDQKERVATRQVACPACGVSAPYTPANAFRPFCSARCKNHDLGAWSSEEFRLPDAGAPDELLPGTGSPS